jgi:energy-coupling factor transporter ATP-binding protein EcfA2
VLIIDHDMDLVFRFAERITGLVGGAVFATGTPQKIGWLGVLAVLLAILNTRVGLVRFREKYAPQAKELVADHKG